MLGQSVQDAVNTQINNELFSGYQYLSMSAHCESIGFPGFARWMRAQAEEELEHAMKFFDYIHDRGGKVMLQPIAQPQLGFGSPLALFETALAQEQKVTGMINELYRLSQQENDYASQTFLQWFVTEQVEEERNVGRVVEMLRMVDGNSSALLTLDRELGQREAK